MLPIILTGWQPELIKKKEKFKWPFGLSRNLVNLSLDNLTSTVIGT